MQQNVGFWAINNKRMRWRGEIDREWLCKKEENTFFPFSPRKRKAKNSGEIHIKKLVTLKWARFRRDVQDRKSLRQRQKVYELEVFTNGKDNKENFTALIKDAIKPL